MRFEVDFTSFLVKNAYGCEARAAGERTLYVSPGLRRVDKAEDLADCDYGQLVEVDTQQRVVRFGRDYLGHFPLLYAGTEDSLYVSDELSWIIEMLRAAKARLTLSEEAIALYFAMGYVPAGMTIYREIVACEAHALYQWRRGKIHKTSTFAPVEIDPARGLPDLARALEQEVARFAALSSDIDVWCSGGLDSSIMAWAFNTNGRRAELLTVGYGQKIHDNLGDGERSYAYDVARQCAAPIREIALDEKGFERAHERFVATHPGPVIDTCVPPKYALAEASRKLVITGEGSDPLFGGPKNNVMMFAHARAPAVNLGWHYAVSHNRSFDALGKLMCRGAELADYVVEYVNGLLARYPGDLIRRLFYVNTHIKAASLIFTESYYACREKGVEVRHPYAGLGVYRAAFALEDHFKYRFPRNKLALHDLYAERLPASVVNRKKSGPLIPLSLYLADFAAHKFDLAPLLESGLFIEEFIDRVMEDRGRRDKGPSPYGLLTLSEWLRRRPQARPAAGPKQFHKNQDQFQQRASVHERSV